ncbi:unnamed protein product [Soboliphyme baturini]|uniref:Transmembrane protein n=1 Tax=Soboliphyme baturini TaxID=241478 RepID=A0A183IW55_9BILA|nr:unnamed protein product [Soboliphyme baturini]
MLPSSRNSFGADLKCIDRYTPSHDLSHIYRQSLWNEEFCHRPSWCDARLALKQIRKGRAKGNVPALWIRSILQRALFRLGCTIQHHAGEVLFCGILVLCLFSIGLRNTSFETDMDQLWVETDVKSLREVGHPHCRSISVPPISESDKFPACFRFCAQLNRNRSSRSGSLEVKVQQTSTAIGMEYLALILRNCRPK